MIFPLFKGEQSAYSEVATWATKSYESVSKHPTFEKIMIPPRKITRRANTKNKMERKMFEIGFYEEVITGNISKI